MGIVTMVEERSVAQDSGTPVDPMRLLIAIHRRRWFVMAGVLVGVILGWLVGQTLVPPLFEARGVIECDRCSEIGYGDRELVTLQESVKLPQHIERVRQTLDIDDSIEIIARDIEVGTSIESRLVTVTARGKTGAQAAAMVNSVVDSFMETRLSVEQEKLGNRVRKSTKDAEKARAVLADARDKYDQFRRENNIADLPAERQAAIEEAARLRSELAIAQGDELAERARMAALQRASKTESPTTILDRTEELPMTRRLAEKRIALKTARARLSADHPHVLSLAAEVDELENTPVLDHEAVTTERKVGRNPQWDLAQQGVLQAHANKDAASTRQSTYAQLAERAANAAARLTQMEGRGAEFFSNVKIAEQHVATLELALRMAEDAARTPSTGLRILAKAQAPDTPLKSSRRIVTILGPLVGSCFVILGAVLWELRGLRIHTATELAFWSRGPVLASSRWPNVQRALHDLIAELAAPLRQSEGKTLLVSLGTAEMAPVHLLAFGLHEVLDRDPRKRQRSIDVGPIAENRLELRKALHQADRVIVVVWAGMHSAAEVRMFADDIADSGRISTVLINVRSDHAALRDRIGRMNAFWNTTSAVKHIEDDNGSALP